MNLPDSVRAEYAGVYRRLQQWTAPNARARSRQQDLLASGITLARATAAGESLPSGFVKTLARQAGELQYVGTGIAGLMYLWNQAAQRLMEGSTTLAGFEVAATVLPYFLVAAGLGLVVWATREWDGWRYAA